MNQQVIKATNDSKASVRQLKQFAKHSGLAAFYVGGYAFSKLFYNYQVLMMTQSDMSVDKYHFLPE